MKTALVTGAAGGMGKSVCEKLAKEGIKVFALDIKPSEISGTYSFCCDIRNLDKIREVKKKIEKLTDSLDFIVHTAGIYDLDSLTEISDERFTKIFEINVFGVYRINKEFTPFMRKGGRIVIVTSELAPLDPLPFTGLYAVTKAALEKYAHSLRTELKLRGINVIKIRPGAVSTSLLGVSTTALNRFCESTEFYKPNAARFKKIVDSVEAKSVSPQKIGDLVWRALSKKHPRYLYNINRNPLLRLLSALPWHLQQRILVEILKK